MTSRSDVDGWRPHPNRRLQPECTVTPDALATATMPEEADQAQAPAAAGRFGRRWRLVAAGLSNVWRFGDLLLDAGSGRLLMRGANGTGKTTALEGMWPYLLDLNPRLLGAGKARQTTWTSLMRAGANGARRRIGYVLCVPITSSTSCDQPIFVDHATDLSLSSDAVQVEIDWLR